MMASTETAICAGCEKQLLDKKSITCTDNACKKGYHLACVNIKTATTDLIKSWLCPVCRCAKKKGGDNTSTPVRSCENVTVRKPKAGVPSGQVSDPPSESPLTTLTEEIKLLRQEILKMKSDFEIAISAVRHCEKRMDEMSVSMMSYETRLKAAEEKDSERQIEIDKLRTQVANQSHIIASCEARLKSVEENPNVITKLTESCEFLQEQLNFQSQAALRNDIEISGINELPAENPHHLFLTLAAVAGMKLGDADIDSVTRAGPPRGDASDFPRPLVVRFYRRNTRDQFFKMAKPKRLSTKDLKIDGPERNIYFNDRLTRENRNLFRECRTQFKAAGFRFCWTKGGQVFVKQHEGRGAGAKAVIVRSLGHMARILQNSTSAETAGQPEGRQRQQ